MRVLAAWLAAIGAAIWIVAHAHYITDLSAFLPAKPTAVQRLLVDQLRDGPASRLILVALEGADDAARAGVSRAMAARLRRDAAFSSVENGARLDADRDRDFLFRHRYLLSDDVTRERFSAAGLEAAIAETLQDLASATGLLEKSLVTRDPTGEMLHLIDNWSRTPGPRTADGLWVSADGTRTLLIAQTLAAGSDTDAQGHALDAVRAAFRASLAEAGPAAAGVRLRCSGPGPFAVAARATIQHAAERLSVVSTVLVIVILLAAYRSLTALALGLLPVVTGALTGIAAVALGFGAVHGVTLGFGITLIGESVDYSVYFFIQSARGPSQRTDMWRQLFWPTVRLGMLASVCGFASLLPSGFPGLAQLGLYSISGLVAAALVTRFVLPQLLPADFAIHDLAPLGRRLGRIRQALQQRRGALPFAAALIAAVSLGVLQQHRGTLWNRELSALSPIPARDLAYDAMLRADLGTADVLDLVIVEGPALEAVLAGAERAGAVLVGLQDAGIIGGFDSPALYLPSRGAQERRRNALPDRRVLLDELQHATSNLDLAAERLGPFVDDVEAARQGPLLTPADLAGTSLAGGFSALVLHRADRWTALLPLHAPLKSGAPSVDVGRVGAALAAARLDNTQVLDLKAETDALYAGYLQDALRLSSCGLALIAVLLLTTLRSSRRTARVLLPLVLAVLIVAAALAACDVKLTILHLVGMLLIVAVGSNYALFFDHEAHGTSDARDAADALTLASLAIANLCTVIGFGLLAFSGVPVLEALGVTVAPGTFLALVWSGLLTPRTPATRSLADA